VVNDSPSLDLHQVTNLLRNEVAQRSCRNCWVLRRWITRWRPVMIVLRPSPTNPPSTIPQRRSDTCSSHQSAWQRTPLRTGSTIASHHRGSTALSSAKMTLHPFGPRCAASEPCALC